MDPRARKEAALAGLSRKKLRMAQAGLGCSIANLFCFEAARLESQSIYSYSFQHLL